MIQPHCLLPFLRWFYFKVFLWDHLSSTFFLGDFIFQISLCAEAILQSFIMNSTGSVLPDTESWEISKFRELTEPL